TRKPCDFPSGFNIESYQVFQGMPSFTMRDGDIIELGNRRLQVLHTPGHSPGHCCFYEKERGYLYSGDLIYSGCLDAFYPSTNPIEFMNSVDKIRKLDIQKICPSHHEINIPIGIVDRIYDAFCEIHSQNKFQHGNGIFDFGDFQIHI
ncbi:MAG: MBL fold metallo-hydrolase, partial [Clostridia bacterium]|nr:MBL fold metallo-hydrolase [Clostridia bacterium]